MLNEDDKLSIIFFPGESCGEIRSSKTCSLTVVEMPRQGGFDPWVLEQNTHGLKRLWNVAALAGVEFAKDKGSETA